jgi:hypothetical protein
VRPTAGSVRSHLLTQRGSGGSQARAVVQFDGVGVKTLVLEYARLQIVR